MKIVIAGTRGVPAAYGGFETYAENLAIELTHLGHDVAVICPQSTKSDQLPARLRPVRRIFVWDFENAFQGRYLRAVGTIFYDFFSLIKASLGRADLILLCGYASGPCMCVPRVLGVPLVVNPDGLEWNSKRWGRLARFWLFLCEKLAAHLSSALIVDAEPIQRRFREAYNVNSHLVTYGAPVVRSAPAEISDLVRGEFFLCVARMVPETSIPMIVEGYLASDVSAKLILLGPIKDRKFYAEQVKPLLSNKVVHIGAIYDQSIVQSLRFNCEALIHGHASEGTNPSLVESLACGSMVYSIDTASNRAVLGTEGIYFKDESELASKLSEHERIKVMRGSLIASNNYKRAEQMFSWKAKAEQHEKIFEGLLK